MADETAYLLGIDGGGTRCRARITDLSGTSLGEGIDGPANIRLGLEASFAAVLEATMRALGAAALSPADLGRTTACLALAGATEPSGLAAAQQYRNPFRHCIVTSDAHAACVGAHEGRDGGVIVVGTGAVGWAISSGRQQRVGGWGFPLSDEGSGAWLGAEALRRVLWARDGRIGWTPLLETLFGHFQSDPHAIVRWMTGAGPRDFGSFAPAVVEHARSDDPVAADLVRQAAGHVDALAERLIASGADRLSLVGGLGPHLEPWLAQETTCHLVTPQGDALTGALRLAGAAARVNALAG